MNRRLLVLAFLLSFGWISEVQGQSYQYDVNQDGSVNITDAILVIDKILGKPIDENGTTGTDTTSTKTKNMEEWAKLGSGLFIHWGIYSVLAGHFTGYDRYGNYVDSGLDALGGWIFPYKRIPDETYKAYESQFTASEWDADAIAKMAYDSGLKYIVITAKHHEGFTLYDSQYANWDISTSGAAGKDPLMDLKKACDKYGLKFCLYFSQFRDWMAEGGFGQEWKQNNKDPYTEQQHSDYINMTINILKEMINKYNPYVLWYDGPIAEDKYADLLFNAQKEYFPNTIINWRLYKNYTIGDFATGEATFFWGDRTQWPYAENCFTTSDYWGYMASKDTEENIKSKNLVIGGFIIQSRSWNQNVLLNIGPKADGSIPQYVKNLFSGVSEYVQKYGTFENTLSPNVHSFPNWGRVLKKDKTLKVYVMDGSSTIRLDGIHVPSIKSIKVYDIENESSENNHSILSDGTIVISNIPTHEDASPAVVDIEFNDEITSEIYSNVLDDNNLTLSALAFNSHQVRLHEECYDKWKTIGWRIGWKSSIAYIETYFKYQGTTGNYKVRTTIRNGDKSVTATAILTDMSDNFEQSYSYTISSPTSTNTVKLINGNIYKLKISHDGTTVSHTGSGSLGFEKLTFIK